MEMTLGQLKKIIDDAIDNGESTDTPVSFNDDMGQNFNLLPYDEGDTLIGQHHLMVGSNFVLVRIDL